MFIAVFKRLTNSQFKFHLKPKIEWHTHFLPSSHPGRHLLPLFDICQFSTFSFGSGTDLLNTGAADSCCRSSDGLFCLSSEGLFCLLVSLRSNLGILLLRSSLTEKSPVCGGLPPGCRTLLLLGAGGMGERLLGAMGERLLGGMGDMLRCLLFKGERRSLLDFGDRERDLFRLLLLTIFWPSLSESFALESFCTTPFTILFLLADGLCSEDLWSSFFSVLFRLSFISSGLSSDFSLMCLRNLGSLLFTSESLAPSVTGGLLSFAWDNLGISGKGDFDLHLVSEGPESFLGVFSASLFFSCFDKELALSEGAGFKGLGSAGVSALVLMSFLWDWSFVCDECGVPPLLSRGSLVGAGALSDWEGKGILVLSECTVEVGCATFTGVCEKSGIGLGFVGMELTLLA